MRQHAPILVLLSGAFLLLGSLQAGADNRPPTPQDYEFFESNIRPVLIAECVDCHGPDKQKGGLRLDSKAGWQHGGDSGAAILPYNPDDSLLLRSIRHTEPDLKMPEKAPKLDEAVVKNFAKWIAAGAPDPREKPAPTAAAKPAWPDLLQARRSWWSLQPLVPPPTPTPVAGPAQDAPSRTIDIFLNDAIQKAGLNPAPHAPPHVLARRLHFLLTGLPPSAADVDSFATAHAKNPAEALRERTRSLLASPAFGEHWARHWMDLVRYAESHGSEGDPEIPGAFHYRDYLVRAFNSDVPLNQLILEHIAGDLLERPRISSAGLNESRIGPAHLRMNEHGYQPVDTRDDQVQAVDNQIDVVTKAFQALTVSCARCHDHKFDAISQRDYTALYGIFSSVRPAQVPVESDARLQLDQKTELQRLKLEIKEALSKEWLKQCADLPQSLATAARPQETQRASEIQKRLQSVEQRISQRLWNRTLSGQKRLAPAPYALWSFAKDARELTGKLHSELSGGARVENGALILDGKSACLKTDPIPVDLKERTYEAWITPSNLNQRGGGIVGLEQIEQHAFDSLVFGERQPGKWLPGSNNFKRTEQPDGEAEAASSQLVHIAVAYASDGTISVFRNGQPYGKPYRKADLHTFPASNARVLIGLRHTGAGNGFFAGAIEEIRIHTRALTPGEVGASFSEGPLPNVHENSAAPQSSSEDKQAISDLEEEARALRSELAAIEPPEASQSFAKAISAQDHPLHLAAKAATLDPGQFASTLGAYRTKHLKLIAEAKAFNESNFQTGWNLSAGSDPGWFTSGPDAARIQCGDFRVNSEGNDALTDLLPAGIAASTLVPQFGGVAMSPDFKISSPSISVRFAATQGSMLRVIPDNYPLGSNSIFPRAVVQRAQSGWTRLDSSYRLNANAYIECSTPGHQTRRAEAPKGSGDAHGTPFFIVENVLFHDGKEAPRELHPGLEMILDRCNHPSSSGFLQQFQSCLKDSIEAWRKGDINEPQRELLSAAIQTRLLSSKATLSPELNAAVARYRALTKSMPSPAFVPGVLEHQAKNAPFLPRGDYKKPGDPVPRGFLEVLDNRPIQTAQSGRLELAERILSSSNPLTARVMTNRVWLWIFGQGLVPTPDNFGRMGEKPTHPELLDYLALQLGANGWSLKHLLETLTQTEAFSRSSTPSGAATEKDPTNALLSHAHVRRLEAEAIRDAMLSVSGMLNPTLSGPSVATDSPRRSLYLQQKRNNLPSFLATFDAPKPFTTLGKRDVTTVPAQSLTLLNDPAVLKFAQHWSASVQAQTDNEEDRIRILFKGALGRPSTPSEALQAGLLLRGSSRDGSLAPLAHAIFNLKEFIYLR